MDFMEDIGPGPDLDERFPKKEILNSIPNFLCIKIFRQKEMLSVFPYSPDFLCRFLLL
jgi:hypothetical protein